eukprot:6572483-Prymnesium_polylepis.2
MVKTQAERRSELKSEINKRLKSKHAQKGYHMKRSKFDLEADSLSKFNNSKNQIGEIGHMYDLCEHI